MNTTNDYFLSFLSRQFVINIVHSELLSLFFFSSPIYSVTPFLFLFSLLFNFNSVACCRCFIIEYSVHIFLSLRLLSPRPCSPPFYHNRFSILYSVYFFLSYPVALFLSSSLPFPLSPPPLLSQSLVVVSQAYTCYWSTSTMVERRHNIYKVFWR